MQKMGMSYAVSISVFGVLTLVFLAFSLTVSTHRPIGFSFGKAASLCPSRVLVARWRSSATSHSRSRWDRGSGS